MKIAVLDKENFLSDLPVDGLECKLISGVSLGILEKEPPERILLDIFPAKIDAAIRPDLPNNSNAHDSGQLRLYSIAYQRWPKLHSQYQTNNKPCE